VATHDYVIANGTGAAVRSDLNGALAAIVSQNSSASEPATMYAYMLWADTTAGIMKMRNGANSAWVSLWELDGTFIATDISLSAGTAGAPSLYFTGDTNTGIYSPGADQVAISTGGTGRLFVDASGRVGVGTASPDANLTIGGLTNTGGQSVDAINVNRTDGLRLFGVKWDVTSNEVRFSGNSKNYVFRNGSSEAETARITSAGLVGIGTSSVSELLQVSKTGGANIQVDSGSSNVVAKFGASGAGAFVGSTSNDYFQIYSNNTARIHVTSAGLVGIGTAVPGVALDVSGSIRSNNTISYEDGTVRNVLSSNGTSGILGTTTNHPVVFFANNGEAARIDSSRRLLVGTSSSSADTRALFQATPADGTGFGTILITRGSSTGLSSGYALGSVAFSDSGHTKAAQIDGYVDGTWTSGSSQPSRLVFSTTADGASSPTERCRITSDGRFGVNATNFANGRLITESDGTAITPFVVRDTAAGTSSVNSVGFFRNATQVGSIALTGSATAYNTSSDYRLKENVVAVPDGITRLQQLKPSRFNFIADPDNTVDGFIAHEAQAVVPECVTGEKDAIDDDGNPVYQGIDQSKLVPLLTAALQEAVAEIKALKDRVTALESA
jgi:hypothetical protein